MIRQSVTAYGAELQTCATTPFANTLIPMANDVPLPPGYSVPEKINEDEIGYLLDLHLSPGERSDEKLLRFIHEYLENRSAKEAAREAGYIQFERIGPKLLKRRNVWNAIQAITKAGLEKYGYTAEEAIERVKDNAFYDPKDAQRPDGTWINNIAEFPFQLRMAIRELKVSNRYDTDINGVKTVVGEIIEIKFNNRMDALKMLGPEKGILKQTQVVEHDIGKNMSEHLLESERRALGERDVSAVPLPLPGDRHETS